MKMLTRALLIVAIFAMFAFNAFADVTGPTGLTEAPDQRLQYYGPKVANATAGNITEINLTGWSITRTWAGFYGEVRGTIVLADQLNNTLYDWNNAEPRGEVYAARTSGIDWTTVACATLAELSGDEADFTGTNETDREGYWPYDRPNATFVNSTNFNQSKGDINGHDSMYANYSTFWVGPIQINGTGLPGECFSTVMHNETGWVDNNQNAGNDKNHWREIALADGDGDGNIIYTALMENSRTYTSGFDGEAHDFQMMVGENGHGTDISPTLYYFWVEIE